VRTTLSVLVATIALTACSTPAPETPPAPAAVQPGNPAVTPLMPGMGNHHHPISTTNAEAQRYFDQGCDLVFGFNHEEAVRSFKRAAELDPKAAMPHWGIAWALGPNYNLDVDDDRAKQANGAMAQALASSESGPEAERGYIEAMAIRFPTDPKPDRAALARKYADAMRVLSRRYPDDLDAATLYAESLMNLRAWKLWSLDGKPADRTDEILSLLESVLARDPNHLGANHYYIHTVEASPAPARALPSAARLSTLAPAAGHLSHMPAHIYARVGDHAAAARANEAGANADREYFKHASADSSYAMAYFAHNLHFLADSEMMGTAGRRASSRRRSGGEAGAAHADDADGRVAHHDEDRRAAALRPPLRDSRAGAAAGGSSGRGRVVALRARRRPGPYRQGGRGRKSTGRARRDIREGPERGALRRDGSRKREKHPLARADGARRADRVGARIAGGCDSVVDERCRGG
jgi:tetratricopeptide (TPR) repeat protein